MELHPLEIPRTGAREAAAAYRRQARHEGDARARHELEQIAEAYEHAVRGDRALISLSRTLVAGGIITRTLVRFRGRPFEKRDNYALPNLAVVRADARFAYTTGVQRNGEVDFCDRLEPSDTLRNGRVTVPGFKLPSGHAVADPMGRNTRSAWGAMAPVVPPDIRPRLNARLSRYLTMWEVGEWRWHTAPSPPTDPALLEHVGGDIYSVVATWDLTELERLVLTGRVPDERGR